LRRLALAVLASCVDTAPGYRLDVPPTPGEAEVGSFHFADTSDDVHGTCAPGGARDLSFELTSDVTQTVVFDTDPDTAKTTMPVAMSLFDGPCPPAQMIGCRVGPCPGVPYGNLAATLQAQHTYCLVVEEADPANAGDLVTIRMFTSGRTAVMIFDGNPVAMPGNTCSGDDPSAPPFSCASGSSAPSSAAVVTVCPGVHHLSGTVQLANPVAFSLHAPVPSGPEVACFAAGTSGAIGTPENLPGPQPFWLLMEHASPAVCGGFQLAVTVQ